MTDPTPKPWWPPHAARRHVQEPAPDAEPAELTTWPEDAVQEVERLRGEVERRDRLWAAVADDRDDAKVRAETAEAALAQSEKARRGQQVQIEAQRATLDRVRALAEECERRARAADRKRRRSAQRWAAQALDLRAVLDAPQPCPTCSGPIRETVGMVCQTCGTDYAPQPEAGGDDE